MATLKEQDIVLTSKDASGNPVIQMPITRAGNVEDLTSTCLPLSGGTMKGTVKTSNTSTMMQVKDDSYIGIYGGTAYNKGAYGVFYGVDNADNPGSAAIQTYDADGNSKRLILKPDGTATWGGKDLLTTTNGLPLSGGTMTGVIVHTTGDLIRNSSTNMYSSIKGGTNDSNGAYVTLYGKDREGSVGKAVIGVNHGTNKKLAEFRPDGTFLWDSKNVVRSVNGTSADSAGNVTISIPATPNAYVKASSMTKSGGYMWFSNGFLICWGNAEVSKDATKTVTFGKAFSTVYGITTADFYDTNNSWNFIGTSLTNTNATFRSSGMPRTFYYLAYGYAS